MRAFPLWLTLLPFLAAIAYAQQPIPEPTALAPAANGPWEMEDSFSKASLRGIHAVGGGIAWASGTDGTVLRTEDGGYMWQSCALPPGAEKLDFRGTWAWDANTAVVVSSGPGELSRLYKTTDGCSSWKLLYTNPDKDGFWDAIVFSDRANGLVLGDPVPKPSSGQAPEQVTADHRARRFALFSTNDGGAVWRPLTQESLQTATEASIFAASNSSLWATPSLRHEPWYLFGTGGAAGPSVYRLM